MTDENLQTDDPTDASQPKAGRRVFSLLLRFAWPTVIILLLIAGLAQPMLLVPGSLIAGAVVGIWRAIATRKLGSFFLWFVPGMMAYLAATAGLLLALPYAHPGTVAAWQVLPFVVVIATTVALVTWGLSRNWALHRWVATGVAAATVLGLLTWTNFSSGFVQWQMAVYLNPDDLTALPETVNNRLVPRLTAKEFLENANNDNRVGVVAPHLVESGGKMWWRSARYLDVWYGRLLGTTTGITSVDAGSPHVSVELKDTTFIFGDRSWIADGIFAVRHPFAKSAERVYVQKSDGSWSYLISYTGWYPTFTGTMVEWISGVMEIDENGWVSDHSVTEADRLFPGAALFPPSLAREYAIAYGSWRGGLSSLVTFKGLMEISEDPKMEPTENRYPFFQDLKTRGLSLVVPFEPAGDSSFALTEVLFFDGQTGQPVRYVTPNGTVLNGPRRAVDNVRNANSQVDWSNWRKLEPRLVVGKNGVFILVAMVDKDPGKTASHALIMNVLIDARTMQAYEVHNESDLERIANGSK